MKRSPNYESIPRIEYACVLVLVWCSGVKVRPTDFDQSAPWHTLMDNNNKLTL